MHPKWLNGSRTVHVSLQTINIQIEDNLGKLMIRYFEITKTSPTIRDIIVRTLYRARNIMKHKFYKEELTTYILIRCEKTKN